MAKSLSKLTWSKSFVLALVVHGCLLALLIFTFNIKINKPPVTVNLQRNADAGKNMIKAGLVNKKNIDLIYQHHEQQARILQERLAEEKRVQEKLEREKFAAEQLAQQRKAQEKMAAEKLIQQRKAREKAAADKIAADKLAKEVTAQQKLAQKQAQQKPAQQKSTNDRQKRSAAQPVQVTEAKGKASGLKAGQDSMRAMRDAFIADEVEKYKAVIAASIIENRTLSSLFEENLSCTIRVSLLPDGSISNARIEKSSGNSAYDDMSLKAIYKSAPFTMPEEPDLYAKLREIVLSFKNLDQITDVL